MTTRILPTRSGTITLLRLEPSVTFQSLNPDWNRTFVIETRIEKGNYVFYRCRWDPPPAEEKDRHTFIGFGAVHIKSCGITEAWPRLTLQGKEQDIDLENRGMNEIMGYFCQHCKDYARKTQTRRQVASEVVEIVYTCERCGHKELDVID